MLLVFGAPCQLRLLAGQEHGRTIPLAEVETAPHWAIVGHPKCSGRASFLHFISCQCALLGERAALLPWSRIENRAVDFAGGAAREGDPRTIAALDVEFILRVNRQGRRLTLVEIED